MGHMDDVFKRMNLNQILSFILCGAGDLTAKPELYCDRLKNGCAPMQAYLGNFCQGKHERDQADAALSQALSAYERVYMELGMKAGARLLWQLLLSDDPQPIDGGAL